MTAAHGPLDAVPAPSPPEPRLCGDVAAMDAFAGGLTPATSPLPQRLVADPEHVERDLARLVLTVIELLRRLLEQQAVRRIEGGSLTDEQIERMGDTFMKLDQKMSELAAAFGLERHELNLRLGPLGDLM